MLLFPSWQGQSKPSLPLSFFLLFSISSQSPTPTIFCCCSSFSSHSFQIYLNINPVLPSVFLASFFSQLSGQLISASFSSAICFTLPAHFSLVLTNFFLKLSFPSNLHQFIHSSLICSLHSHDSSYPVVFAIYYVTYPYFCTGNMMANHFFQLWLD